MGNDMIDGRLLMESGPVGTRAFVDCPATGYRREVKAIEYMDGGRLEFPHDFSANCNAEQARKALPEGISCTAWREMLDAEMLFSFPNVFVPSKATA
jgi:hypothetical protein